MSTYLSATDAAKQIRSEIKRALGANRSKVSVRARQFSMGSSIDVTVKDAGVPIEAVREIVTRQEQISRDEATGEILSGCNRYTHVRYSDDVIRAFAEPHLAAVQTAVDELRFEEEYGLMREVAPGFRVSINRGRVRSITVWEDGGGHHDTNSVFDAAVTIGKLVLLAERRGE